MSSSRSITLLFILLLPPCIHNAVSETDLLAHWVFDVGSGEVLHGRSGLGIDGTIVGAQWIKTDHGQGLRFSGSGSYIEFGDNKDLKSVGDSTFLAWVELDASPYPDEATNWTLIDCEDYQKEGFVLRIDGATARVMYRSSHNGFDHFGFGVTSLNNKTVYFIALVRRGEEVTLYINGVLDARFQAKSPALGKAPFRISAPGQSFAGVMYELAIMKSALDQNEVLEWFWGSVPRYLKDVVHRGSLTLKPHIYYQEKEVCAEVDFLGVMPLAPEERILVDLSRMPGAGGDPEKALIESQIITTLPSKATGFYSFDLKPLQQGCYELHAQLMSSSRAALASATFEYPAPVAMVPSPEMISVESLPREPASLKMDVDIMPGGGMLLTTGETSFPVESAFSFPGNAVNTLACADTLDRIGEPDWEVEVKEDGLSAKGRFYTISRLISQESHRILVSDTISNNTSLPQGIMIHNRLNTKDIKDRRVFVGGREAGRAVPSRPLKTCPLLFAAGSGLGIGLAALDDVYVVQARGSFDEKGWLDLFTNEFALDAGASYTFEWAVYPNSTGDYFDLVNAIRRDENRNHVTVDGSLAFLQGTQQKRDTGLVPPAEYFDIRNVLYATVFCLSWCTDDPSISIEGIEFVEYPLEKQRIAGMMSQLTAVKPDVKGMFHIAHQLYATNQPETLFPDSRVMDSDGKQVVYPYNYANGNYFSQERYEQNWRWWIFYPTLGNSFGEALLKSVDVMMDELGCRGVFSDGFLWGYGADYTYDCWDGHSADIDPNAHHLLRKKGSAVLLTQEAMIAWCRKIWDKGGVVIANGVVPTRTICSLPLITDKEVNEGPDVPLLPTPITLGDPAVCGDEIGLYHDVLNKLRWGNLYFYYNEPRVLAYESLPQKMYPITVQEIHAGIVKGKERIITMHSGVYGWKDSRALVCAYRYDSRGHRIPANFLTTADSESVRTKVVLEENESAVLALLPIQITSSRPVNVIVDRLEDKYVIRLNGKGETAISVGEELINLILDGTREVDSPFGRLPIQS